MKIKQAAMSLLLLGAIIFVAVLLINYGEFFFIGLFLLLVLASVSAVVAVVAKVVWDVAGYLVDRFFHES